MEGIIIKTYSRSLISGEQGVEFELVTDPHKDGKMPFCKECHKKYCGHNARKRKAEEQPKEGVTFADCKTEEDCATAALEFAIGKEAFKEWKATNELHETLVRFYSR